MSVLYLTGLTLTQATLFSRTVYMISRPLYLHEQENDTTTMAMAIIKHPSNDEHAVVIPSGYSVPRNAQVAKQLQQDNAIVFTAYDGMATTEEVEYLTQHIIQNDRISIDSLLTQEMTGFLKTKTDMIADGWFVSE